MLKIFIDKSTLIKFKIIILKKGDQLG